MAVEKQNGSILLFVALAVGIVGSYSVYGYLQEGLYVEQEDGTKFKYVSLLLVVQLLVSFVVASAAEVLAQVLFPKAAETAPKQIKSEGADEQKHLLSFDGLKGK